MTIVDEDFHVAVILLFQLSPNAKDKDKDIEYSLDYSSISLPLFHYVASDILSTQALKGSIICPFTIIIDLNLPNLKMCLEQQELAIDLLCNDISVH